MSTHLIVRQISFVLLRIEAVLLVFPTLLGVMVLVGTAELMWRELWVRGQLIEALMWALMLLSLVAAWWLLLRYFYAGWRAAREVPAAIWIFATLIALLSSIGFVVETDESPLEFLTPGILFVPTFIHLSAEVWLMRPDETLEPARGE